MNEISPPPLWRVLARAVAAALALFTLLLLVTELLSFAFLRIQEKPSTSELSEHSFYAGKPWKTAYWKEFDLSNHTRFEPYILWRRRPFRGTYITVGEDGKRRTVNPNCSPQAPVIWMFGSSSLWGTGCRDEETIPSLLSAEYGSSAGPVCVTNFGETGWVSTQNLVMLEIALKQSPRPPDLVVLYEGFSDAATAYEFGIAGQPSNVDRMRAAIDAGRQKPVGFDYIKETATYRFLSWFMTKLSPPRAAAAPVVRRDLDRLAADVVREYRTNLDCVEALSRRAGFRYAAYWGPVLGLGNKPLAPAERRRLAQVETETPGLIELSRKSYEGMSKADDRVHSLADAFSDMPQDLYLDVAHVTPEGNRRIAHLILEDLRKSGRAPVSKP